ATRTSERNQNDFIALIGNGRGFLLGVRMEQQDILLKNGEVVQEKSQCHYAAGWPSRRISDCVPHFQNRKIYPFASSNSEQLS
ncbi:hypothetical protein Q7404_11525, partial [Glaesserella parasuis]|nr:hypothetical protein [Glaesserella parasuis]